MRFRAFTFTSLKHSTSFGIRKDCPLKKFCSCLRQKLSNHFKYFLRFTARFKHILLILIIGKKDNEIKFIILQNYPVRSDAANGKVKILKDQDLIKAYLNKKIFLSNV